jgi:hypothetical protein
MSRPDFLVAEAAAAAAAAAATVAKSPNVNFSLTIRIAEIETAPTIGSTELIQTLFGAHRRNSWRTLPGRSSASCRGWRSVHIYVQDVHKSPYESKETWGTRFGKSKHGLSVDCNYLLRAPTNLCRWDVAFQ